MPGKDYIGCAVGTAQIESVSLVAAPGVVVLDVLGHDDARVPFAGAADNSAVGRCCSPGWPQQPRQPRKTAAQSYRQPALDLRPFIRCHAVYSHRQGPRRAFDPHHGGRTLPPHPRGAALRPPGFAASAWE